MVPTVDHTIQMIKYTVKNRVKQKLSHKVHTRDVD